MVLNDEVKELYVMKKDKSNESYWYSVNERKSLKVIMRETIKEATNLQDTFLDIKRQINSYNMLNDDYEILRLYTDIKSTMDEVYNAICEVNSLYNEFFNNPSIDELEIDTQVDMIKKFTVSRGLIRWEFNDRLKLLEYRVKSYTPTDKYTEKVYKSVFKIVSNVAYKRKEIKSELEI